MNGSHATPADENAVRAGLRGIVTDLVAQGVGAEAELLRRSRELPARIENPTARPQSKRPEEQRPEKQRPEEQRLEEQRLEEQRAGRTVAKAVLQGFLSGAGDAVARTWLTRWVAPSLTEAIARLEAAQASTPPVTTTAKTPGGTVVVTTEGPDPVGWPKALKNIEALGAVSPVRLGVLTALTALLAVAALVLALIGSSGWAIALVVAAVSSGIGAATALRDRRAWREQREVDLGRAQKAVTDAQDRAVAEEQARRLTTEETRQLAGSLRDLLLQG